VGAKVTARGRTLEAGSTGRDVVALRARLAALRFHVPGPSTTFGWELYDSVIAFQKAYGLSRTGIVDQATWRKLDSAAVLKPRYRGPSPHIEVDKTRQILLVVQQGKVAAILPVSTGATGNTPEGRHAIRWKAPATTTWLGSGILYRTLTFVGNSFAIHGWSSVPPYPASHGCVRIPIWTADWLYNQSPVGETVYVY
jgi:lipoprotein-anchoring transpeptidase ErfK/SrfK